MNRTGQNMGRGGGAEGGTAGDNERSEQCDTSHRGDGRVARAEVLPHVPRRGVPVRG